jgi:hypothetical protein
MTVLVPDYSRRIGVRGKWVGEVYEVEHAEAIDDERRLPARVFGLATVEVFPDRTVLGYRDGAKVVARIWAGGHGGF